MTTTKALAPGTPKIRAAMTGETMSTQPLRLRAPARRLEHAALLLQERDVIILCDLLTYGAMLGEHIHALYFAGCSRRRMNQRLRQLQDAALVVRRPMPLGLSAGLPNATVSTGIPWVYGLGAAGAPLVAARLGWDLAEVRRLARLGTPTAAAHTLEIVSLRVRGEEAVQQRNLERGNQPATAFRFVPERLLRHVYEVRALGGAWRAEAFKPDALMQVSFNGISERYFFVEVDLGHTSSSEWKVKADIAVRYRRSGLFQTRYGAPGFQTLVCTTGERRLAHLRHRLTRHLGEADAAYFGLTTFADIAAKGLFAPICCVPNAAAPLRLEDWAPSGMEAAASVKGLL